MIIDLLEVAILLSVPFGIGFVIGFFVGRNRKARNPG